MLALLKGAVNQRDHCRVESLVESFSEANLQGTELSAIGRGSQPVVRPLPQ